MHKNMKMDIKLGLHFNFLNFIKITRYKSFQACFSVVVESVTQQQTFKTDIIEEYKLFFSLLV